MTTMTAIKITPAPATLTKYTHAVDPHAAQDLAARIAELEAEIKRLKKENAKLRAQILALETLAEK